MSNIKFLSINKQYRRLFNGPIDPTMSWDNLDDLETYLRSPTCYINQIVGCLGKAYIIAEQNGEKVLVEIGSTGTGGGGPEIPSNIMDLINGKAEKIHTHKATDIEDLINGDTLIVAGYHIGPEPPANTSLLWIDTTDSTIDSSLDSIIINELRSIISSLVGKIDKLTADVEYLKTHNGGGTPDETFDILTENGYTIITEDGYNVILDSDTITIETFDILTEDGYVIIGENGDIIVDEEYYPLLLEFNIRTEALDDLITENGDSLVLEEYYYQEILDRFNVLTEGNDEILTEDGFNIVLEEFVTQIMTEDNYSMLSEEGIYNFILENT